MISSISLLQAILTRTCATGRTCSISMSRGMASSSPLQIIQIPCLEDNFGYLIHDSVTGQTAAVDTPDASAYQRELDQRGWTLTHILNTHHHFDHTGGNLALKKEGVTIYGPSKEQTKIPGIDVAIQAGSVVDFGGQAASVLDVGGHTLGHVAYLFQQESTIFVGDSLFALGCGRMFEGTPIQFWTSLKELRDLPDETVVYCAHEYTASNAKFAVNVEPGNVELIQRVKDISRKRSLGEPTVPTTIGVEKRTNPFLRVDISEEIRRNVGVTASDSDADAFGKVRAAKDKFRG